MAAIHHTITPIMSLKFGQALITDLSVWDSWQPFSCEHESSILKAICLPRSGCNAQTIISHHQLHLVGLRIGY